MEEKSLEVRFPTSSADMYDYTLSPLFQKIDLSASSYRVTPHKIEITLTKSVPGVKWTALEGDEDIEPTVKAHVAPISGNKPPTYPTSSKSGPKDWDSVVGGEQDDADSGDEMNSFFKKMYKDADDDTKRAMMKSYQESNGTALSTSWAEVRKKKVETTPPDGLEAKPW